MSKILSSIIVAAMLLVIPVKEAKAFVISGPIAGGIVLRYVVPKAAPTVLSWFGWTAGPIAGGKILNQAKLHLKKKNGDVDHRGWKKGDRTPAQKAGDKARQK